MDTALHAAASRLETKMKEAETLLKTSDRATLQKECETLRDLVSKQSELLAIQGNVIAKLEADLRSRLA
jgi:hypothetical protein